MSATITVGGNLIGRVWEDRTDEDSRSLAMSLDGAERILDVLPVSGNTERPKIGDRGKGLITWTLTTERVFETPSAATMWLLETADSNGYAGVVEFSVPEGDVKSFDYGVATPGGSQQMGARIMVRWRIVCGRKLE